MDGDGSRWDALSLSRMLLSVRYAVMGYGRQTDPNKEGEEEGRKPERVLVGAWDHVRETASRNHQDTTTWQSPSYASIPNESGDLSTSA